MKVLQFFGLLEVDKEERKQNLSETTDKTKPNRFIIILYHHIIDSLLYNFSGMVVQSVPE